MAIKETFTCNLSLNSLVFLLFSVHYSYALSHPLCHDDDRSSLLQFKHSFVFDKFNCDPSTYNYTKLTSWKVGVDCCSWNGVGCDVETGHVIGLNLSSSCLYGSINSSSPLFRLVHLKSLDLSSNNFNVSTIPGAIRNLSQLTDLNLNYSNFVGQIPSEILELPNMVSLDLSWNLLMLQKPSLKDVVETFTGLVKLHLSQVPISSRVPQRLSNLTSLSSLILTNCSLIGEFPPGVFQLPSLRVLDFRFNSNITGYLPDFDNVSSPLEELWLDGTNFTGQLPVSVGNLKSLGVFSAWKCHFWGAIPSSVGKLTYLNTLVLSNNYFSGEIPSSLGTLLRLTLLDLSNNNFSNSTLSWVSTLANLQTLCVSGINTFGKIPSSLGNLTRLTNLELIFNQLTGQIPSWVGNFTELVELSLSENQLQGEIPESIFRLPNLQLLFLAKNYLTGSLKYDSFLQMQHLSKLYLSDNHLSIVSSPHINVTLPKFKILGMDGCNISEFPAFLRGQSELEYLFLNDNNIEGYIPTWLSSLKSLTYLALGNNSLIGFEHPLSISSLPNLRHFDISCNQFEGSLPLPSLSIAIYHAAQNKFTGHISPLFCNLTSALWLQFSDNNLSGTLPPCFASSVVALGLSNNSLSGEIPDNFTGACKLEYINFSQNKFEGKVPRSLAKCSELTILNIGDNLMNDVFPSWMGILPHLRILSLRSNQFHGVIAKPLTKFEFSCLQIIDISGNNFRGKLPLEYFRNWIAMKTVRKDHLAYMQDNTSFQLLEYSMPVTYSYSTRIVNKGTDRKYERILEFFFVVDLSSNKFEDEIPEIIGSLRALQSLNLSNNMLTGHIPSSLGNLTMLEALDLSRNELSGQIPVQLALITSLAVFNVSNNSLTGPIPQGNQFDTFENSSFSANPGLCGEILSKKVRENRGLTITTFRS